MGWGFRKRVRLFPGFYLNLSKSGMSATVGMKGFSVNIGEKGTYLNAGVPGTGIYSRTRLDNSGQGKNEIIPQTAFAITDTDNVEEIKSFQPELITSEGMFGLKESIINARNDKEDLRIELELQETKLRQSKVMLIVSYCLLFGLVFKTFKEKYKAQEEITQEAKDTYLNFKIEIDFDMDKEALNEYLTLKKAFEATENLDSIWDVTTSRDNDRVRTRSAASFAIERTKVSFSKHSLDFLNSKYDGLKLQNANGGDLFIYPGFMLMLDKQNHEFALIDYKDLQIEHHEQRFVETQVPPDAKIVDRTWRYVNKNGSPDRRFKDNYEIPIVAYYELTLKAIAGLYESFQFSNGEIGQRFCVTLENYRALIEKMKWKGMPQDSGPRLPV